MKQVLSILEELISIDTTSCHSNLPLVEHIADYLESHGISPIIDYNEDRTKANLIATIGPKKDGGIVLSGHMDVVPVSGQEWSSDPFILREDQGKLYGRGTADMKGFLAACLAMVPQFQQATLEYPIHLVFSYDEEVGCAGVPSAIHLFAEQLPKPAYAIIGEPTEMQVVVGHKGIHVFETTITGKAAHSSLMHEGKNAIVTAGALITHLNQLNQQCQTQQIVDFVPPFMSFNIGKIQGGEAVNIIADHCRFEWEVRSLPGQDISALILDPFHAYAQTLPGKVETTMMCSAPPLEEADDHTKNTVMQLAQTNHQHKVSFATEAGLFHQAGIPAIICGPGSIEQAHKPDEFLEKTQLEMAVAMLERLIQSLAKA